MRNPKFLGVYSLKIQAVSGRIPKFFIWELPDGNYAAQELDASLAQRGPARAVPSAKLKQAFKLEPSILAAPVSTPDFRALVKNAKQAPAEADEADASLAALTRARKAKQLEADMRDNFDRAMCALGRPKDRKGAMAALERLIAAQDGIEPRHKHMFRDFGVALRKKKLTDLALASARRAVALSPNDDHARFNLARILDIAGKYDEAEAQLGAARKLDPREQIYVRMARYLKSRRPGGLSDDEGGE